MTCYLLLLCLPLFSFHLEARSSKVRLAPSEVNLSRVLPQVNVHRSEAMPARAEEGRWPNFCPKHLLQDPKGCSSWGENSRVKPQLEFTLYPSVADCYIDPALLQLVGKKMRLIPAAESVCNYVFCPKCKERVVQGYDDYEHDTLLYKCSCTGKYWIGIDEPLNTRLETIVMGWQFCKLPAIYYGYFDWFHQTYFSFFMNLLNFREEHSACYCYWKERSATSVLISNQVYEALEESLLASHKVSATFMHHFSPYLAERLPHDFLSGLLLHASFFSHYQRIFQDLALFALETLPQEAAWIENRLGEIEQEIAYPFLEHYSACLNRHPHAKIYRERGKLWAELSHPIEALNDYKKVPMTSSETWVEFGKIYAQNFLFDQAVESFTQAIEKNPLEKEAYFGRACAYFEKGEYALSFFDFAHSTFKSTPVSEKNRAFSQALLAGIKEGKRTQIISLGGFSTLLWEENSLSEEIVLAIKALGDFFAEKIPPHRKAFYTLPQELQEYITHKHGLDCQKKGFLLGKILGCYGSDLFVYSGNTQLTQLCEQLQRAIEIFTLERALVSQEEAEGIIEACAHYRDQKALFLAEHKVNWPKQIIKMPSRHTAPLEGSYITLSRESLEKLLKTKAGTGQPVRKAIGEVGYAERVNFGCNIGVWVEKGERHRTSYGIIHYDTHQFYYVLPASPE